MNKLSRKQFDLLVAASEAPLPSQRALASRLDCSVGTVNKLISELTELSYVSDGHITQSGLDALEPYRAKRAVFLAAGFGTRLVPVTLNTPKPLVRVNGKRIIDGLIDAVLAAGIDEIYIVRGYLAEQFDQLLYKYPMIKFLENPAYNESNNISSAMCARYFMHNAYVFEADLLIRDPSLVRRYNYSTNILGIKMDRSDDWCFTVKDGIITEQKVGGINCYQEIGLWYVDEDDGRKLSEHIKLTYDMPGGKERFWDSTVFDSFKNEYKVEIRECKEGSIVEIDTFKELKQLDKTYDV
ncbi:MAG: NTP transferase domain-containing protein [Clostridia bacterium]|nr:NTP transferase domain-containing protein [Clostridia bacterium]